MKQETLIKEYANVKAQLADLEKKEKEMKEAIVAAMSEQGLVKLASVFGTVTLASRKNWEYSEKVEALVEKLKIAKHKEEEKGIAQVKSLTSYMIFSKPKTEKKNV